jgi:L-fuconolactonase
MPGQAHWLAEEASYLAWEYAEANRISVCLQITIAGIPMLRKLLERFPKVRVLLDHLARPDLSDGPPYTKAQPLFDLVNFPGVHLKLTDRTIAAAGEGISTVRTFTPYAVSAFGAERILWGSNFPAAEGTLFDLLSQAKAAVASLPPSERAMIFAGAARNLNPDGRRPWLNARSFVACSATTRSLRRSSSAPCRVLTWSSGSRQWSPCTRPLCPWCGGRRMT